MNQLGYKRIVSDSDLFDFEKQLYSFYKDSPGKKINSKYLQIFFSNYLKDHELNPIQTYEFFNFLERLGEYIKGNMQEIKIVTAEEISCLGAQLRTFVIFRKSFVMDAGENYRLYAMENGDLFYLGKKENKEMVGSGKFKTVKGGKFLRSEQKIVYAVSRGKKHIEMGKREFGHLSRLKGCPGIAQVYHEIFIEAFDTHRGEAKYAMIGERYEGSLDQLNKATLTHREQRQMAADLGDALYQMRLKRIVHRDIKPANLFYYTDPFSGLKRLRLGDFNCAVKVGTKFRGWIGTPSFMSLQQWGWDDKLKKCKNSEKINSFENEVWAVSMTLYYSFVKNPEYIKEKMPLKDFIIKMTALTPDWVDQDMANLSQEERERIDPELLKIIKLGLDINEETRISHSLLSRKLRNLAPTFENVEEGSSSSTISSSTSTTSTSHKRKREAV